MLTFIIAGAIAFWIVKWLWMMVFPEKGKKMPTGNARVWMVIFSLLFAYGFWTVYGQTAFASVWNYAFWAWLAFAVPVMGINWVMMDGKNFNTLLMKAIFWIVVFFVLGWMMTLPYFA